MGMFQLTKLLASCVAYKPDNSEAYITHQTTALAEIPGHNDETQKIVKIFAFCGQNQQQLRVLIHNKVVSTLFQTAVLLVASRRYVPVLWKDPEF